MDHWSAYLDDFPEHNPVNWINGRYDPRAAFDALVALAAAQHRDNLPALNQAVADLLANASAHH
jgi:hypothetical protein